MNKIIAVIRGDGIGPEIVGQAIRVLDAVAAKFGHTFTYQEAPMGGNAINIGLAILECPAASQGIRDGDEVAVDFDTGVITNVTKNETYQAEPFPAFIQEIISKGGLMNSLKG